MSLIKVNTIQNANGTTALVIAANGQLSRVNTAVANVTTLNATSGVLATQNGMTGIAKAWVNFYGVGTATVNASFNVSSVTRNGTGDYTINFTTDMANANYAISFGGTSNGGDASRGTYGILASSIGSAPITMTTSAVRFIGGGKYAEVATSDFYTITAIICGS